MASAQRHSALPDRSVHEFIASALLGGMEPESPGGPDVNLVRRFRRRFQQLTGPVMAKGLEDTLFYRDAPLLARNEVGGDPGSFGVTAEEFHAANAKRAREWPHTMIATATHDTKRGEDARARLLALSQLTDQWAEALRLWEEIATPHLAPVEGIEAPDPNDRMILLQSLLGAWPVDLMDGATVRQRSPLSANAWRLSSSRRCARPRRGPAGSIRTKPMKAPPRDCCGASWSPKVGSCASSRLLRDASRFSAGPMGLS